MSEQPDESRVDSKFAFLALVADHSKRLCAFAVTSATP